MENVAIQNVKLVLELIVYLANLIYQELINCLAVIAKLGLSIFLHKKLVEFVEVTAQLALILEPIAQVVMMVII